MIKKALYRKTRAMEERGLFRPRSDKRTAIQRFLDLHQEVTSVEFLDSEVIVKFETPDFILDVPGKTAVTLITVSCGDTTGQGMSASYQAIVSYLKPVKSLNRPVDSFMSLQEIFDDLEDRGLVKEIIVDHAENRKGTIGICKALESAILDLQHTCNVIAWSLEDSRYKNGDSQHPM